MGRKLDRESETQIRIWAEALRNSPLLEEKETNEIIRMWSDICPLAEKAECVKDGEFPKLKFTVRVKLGAYSAEKFREAGRIADRLDKRVLECLNRDGIDIAVYECQRMLDEGREERSARARKQWEREHENDLDLTPEEKQRIKEYAGKSFDELRILSGWHGKRTRQDYHAWDRPRSGKTRAKEIETVKKNSRLKTRYAFKNSEGKMLGTDGKQAAKKDRERLLDFWNVTVRMAGYENFILKYTANSIEAVSIRDEFPPEKAEALEKLMGK